MNRYLSSLFILFFTTGLSSQIFFTTLPKYLQMFPRYEKNYGECLVEGSAQKTILLRSALVEHHTGNEIEVIELHVKERSTFKIVHHIPAKLCEYDLIISDLSNDAVRRVLKKITNLVAGDFFIVAGQSNAECGFGNGGREHDSVYFSPFNRAIGGNINLVTRMTSDSVQISNIENDCLFGHPHSNFWNDSNYAYSGLWPLKLQYQLSLATGVPNCVVNGSLGGASIAEFYASHTPSHPDSLKHSPDYKLKKPYKLYDRVYKRLYENNATLGVKGVIWYQGETDAIFPLDSSVNYAKRFKKLYTSWLTDYPNIKNIIVLQLNMGCNYINNALIRDIQRRLPDQFSKVSVMSTVGSPRSDRIEDLCHYTIEGYDRIADKLLPMAKKRFYEFDLEEKEILPPNILNVYYSGSKELTLEFDMDIFVEENCWYEEFQKLIPLKDYFFDQDYHKIEVNSLQGKNDKLVLDIKDQTGSITKLTYLPQAFAWDAGLYSGPWIRNANNQLLGAYTFFEFPVSPPANTVSIKKPFYELTVIPNPAVDELKIANPAEKNYEYALIDILGKTVLSGTLHGNETILPVIELPRGIYFLKLWEIEHTEMRKIILR